MSRINLLGILVALCASLAFGAASVAQAAPEATQALSASGDQNYILGTGDVIEVTLLGRTDYDARARVNADGTVLLPLLGPIQASGRSPAALASDVRAALQKGGFFTDPQVHVEVQQVASQYATVLGFVGTPGLVPLDRPYHLSELIARVGGRSSAGADYVILTHPDGKSQRYNLADLATGGMDKDPLVVAGDKIYVPAAENEVFYLSGEVKAPGAYPVSDGMTLRMALARGGGVSENGSEGRIKVVRHGETLKGVKLDQTIVQPGDVITIGQRLF